MQFLLKYDVLNSVYDKGNSLIFFLLKQPWCVLTSNDIFLDIRVVANGIMLQK